MAARTPDSYDVTIMGNKVRVIGTFATNVSNADTWDPGLSTIDGCWIVYGDNTVNQGATYSGGTITFVSGTMVAPVKVMAIGT